MYQTSRNGRQIQISSRHGQQCTDECCHVTFLFYYHYIVRSAIKLHTFTSSRRVTTSFSNTHTSNRLYTKLRCMFYLCIKILESVSCLNTLPLQFLCNLVLKQNMAFYLIHIRLHYAIPAALNDCPVFPICLFPDAWPSQYISSSVKHTGNAPQETNLASFRLNVVCNLARP